MKRFCNKIALVTGAASGIGRATALRLATEGAEVFCVDINETKLGETVAEITDAGGRAAAHVADLRSREVCFDTVTASIKCFGDLDVLANIAGIVRFRDSREMGEDEWNLVLAINLSSPFFLAQAALPHLIERGGNIVNVASNAGTMGQPYTAAYCASKAGLVNLTRALAVEFVKSKVRINCVCPGGTHTNLVSGIEFPNDADDELLRPMFGHRGLSTADEVASVIAFVASAEAKTMHGSIIAADQGLMAG